MVSHFQNPIFDALFCEEERLDDYAAPPPPAAAASHEIRQTQQTPFTFLFDHDLFWEDGELAALLSKEEVEEALNRAARSAYDAIGSDGCLKTARNQGVEWMLKVIGYYGFNAITALLAVDYYDRFVTSLCFQRDKPWMGQLAAVACLSIAAKVEETQVPLLLDLQVEESKYLFEAKTIQRMELLVLSTLQWKMNPVTPASFFDHIARRFELINNRHCEFSRRCESVILSIITDCRLVAYLPSVIAAATMIYVIRELQTCDALEYQDQLMNVLRASKEKVEDCHKLITDVMDNLSRRSCNKRKHESIPSSPSGVIDAYFSSDNSADSWAVTSSVTSSPEPLFKRRSRAQDQHTRLAFSWNE
ncbi:hypothetical protein ABFX02_08G052200 [Erythranthe guttata]